VEHSSSSRANKSSFAVCELVIGPIARDYYSNPVILAYLMSFSLSVRTCLYPGVDKSLARPGRKQSRKHVREARDFNNIETELSSFFFLQGKVPKEIHAILTETLACFRPGRAKDLSAPLYIYFQDVFLQTIRRLSKELVK